MQRGRVTAVTILMRASSRLAQLVLSAVALSAAGCGASGGPPPNPHVNVAISAPTSGATVGVHKVTITGVVTPAGAQVAVNGRPAKVTGSSFTGTLYVASANQKIVVSAVAHGFVASQTSATVSYSPNVAHELVAAAAVNAHPASAGAPKVATSVLTQAFGLSVASITKSGHSPTRVSAAPPSTTGGSASSSPGTSSPTSSGGNTPPPSSGGSSSSPSPTSGSPTTTPPSSTPAPPMPPTPAQIAAAIHDSWLHGCIRVEAGGSIVAYCTCTYDHLASRLQTRSSAEHVLKAMVPYLRTGDFRTLPAYIRRAVDACASKLPPLDPVTGKPVLSAFPGAGHGAAPASNQGGPTDPSTTPVAPTPVAPVPNLRATFEQFGSALTANRPASATPADARSARRADGGAAGARLTSTSGHYGLGESRVVAKALGYALVWVGNHNQSGPYPYWYRVRRRLRHRLFAALKFAA